MIDKGATFSDDKQYRYVLWRWWDYEKPYALFIGLNPSTADANNDDPTIRRCIRFARDWGYGGLQMVNLFAVCATDPKEVLKHDNPVGGSDNDLWIESLAYGAGVIVCAWGAHLVCAWGDSGGHMRRDEQVLSLLDHYELKCLGTTLSKQPRHPLYIKANKSLEGYGS